MFNELNDLCIELNEILRKMSHHIETIKRYKKEAK